jgi:hypothetical protein
MHACSIKVSGDRLGLINSSPNSGISVLLGDSIPNLKNKSLMLNFQYDLITTLDSG